MLRRGMNISVLDNSTVAQVKCLHVIKRRTNARLADLLLTVVKREFFHKRAFRKRFFFAVVVNLKKPVYRRAGAYYVRFVKSGVLLLKDDKQTFFGTRFYARVPQEVRVSCYNEICQYTRKTV